MKAMSLTRDFKETILARAERELEFRQALLEEGVEHLLSDIADLAAYFASLPATP